MSILEEARAFKTDTMVADVDGMLYTVCSNEDVKTVPDAIEGLHDIMRQKAFYANALSVIGVFTHTESTKGGRFSIDPGYQACRAGKTIDPLIRPVKQALNMMTSIKDIPLVVTKEFEADDVMCALMADGTVQSCCTGDKDLRMQSGPDGTMVFVDINKQWVYNTTAEGTLYIDTGLSSKPVKFCGLKGLLYQLLAGDPVDGIKGTMSTGFLVRKYAPWLMPKWATTPSRISEYDRKVIKIGGKTAYKCLTGITQAGPASVQQVYDVIKSLEVDEIEFHKRAYCINMMLYAGHTVFDRLNPVKNDVVDFNQNYLLTNNIEEK